MCGIGGFVVRRGAIDGNACLGSMAEAMKHRGPDDEGLYLSPDGRLGLVNRRLAILDLSSAGHMPMVAASGATITYNGEIYNAGELRTELETLGSRFRSRSDAEVVLHGYEAWGQGIVGRLRGMFAFAVYDDGETRSATPHRVNGGRRLLLARDRLGIKPLYYAATPDAFFFASEVKAFRGLVPRTISPAAVVGYLALGSVPSPWTIYDVVRALEPGSFVTIDIDAPPVAPTVQRYWHLPVESPESAEPRIVGDRTEVASEVRALLQEAVRSHLASDVPLGAFLSGGLDSSAVVALMYASTGGKIRTCSMVFDDPTHSEAVFARAMAATIGAEHHERVITASEVVQNLDQILWAMDQPTSDGVNTYFVSKTAREAGLTVALSGLGGDELFGGYPLTFTGVPRVMRLVRAVQAIPGLTSAARTVVPLLSAHQRWRKLDDAFGRPASPANAYLACRGLFSSAEVRELVTDDVWESGARGLDLNSELAQETASAQTVNAAGPGNARALFSWISRAELRTYTHHQLLRDTDVMSMAHSLEVRVPFLDHRVVEAILRLPADVKIDGGRPKALLVDAVADLLPPLVRAPRPKQGFTFPFDRWLRGPLARVRGDWDRTAGGLLRNGAVDWAWKEYEAGRLHWSRAWALSVLGAWVSACGR